MKLLSGSCLGKADARKRSTALPKRSVARVSSHVGIFVRLHCETTLQHMKLKSVLGLGWFLNA